MMPLCSRPSQNQALTAISKCPNSPLKWCQQPWSGPVAAEHLAWLSHVLRKPLSHPGMAYTSMMKSVVAQKHAII